MGRWRELGSILAVVGAISGACSAGDAPAQRIEGVDQIQQALPGSCNGSCNGQSSDGCWCDLSCTAFGDCCDDFTSICSCANACGSRVPGCWCDEFCHHAGDCCPDKVDQCGTNELDVLFVIDDSGDMPNRIHELVSKLSEFYDVLRLGADTNGDHMIDLPGASDLRIGVVTTSAFDFPIQGLDNCDSGDQGILESEADPAGLGLTCPFFWGSPWDSDPSIFSSAEILRNMSCRMAVAADGCGFEHTLESSLLALWPSSDPRVLFLNAQGQGDRANAGFVRPNAMLAIIYVSLEDDCSALHQGIFVPPEHLSPSDPLFTQPLELRCFYNAGTLYQIDRYTTALSRLKPNNQLFVGALVGVPPSLTANPVNLDDTAQRTAHYQAILNDNLMQENVDPADPRRLLRSCQTASFSAYPPRRLVTATQNMGSRGMVQSLCETDLTVPLRKLGTRVITLLNRE